MRTNPAILAEKARARKTSLRWLIALSTLPLFGVVAAFGIAPPDPRESPPALDTVVQAITLPASPTIAAGDFWRQEKIQRGDTVASLLSRLSVSQPDTVNKLRALKDAEALYKLVPGRTIEARTTADGDLLALNYTVGDRMFVINRAGDKFSAQWQPLALEPRLVTKSAVIKSSLFAATDDANIPDAVASQIPDLFSTDVDFHLDLRKGDKLTVVYEVFYNAGEAVKTGRVLAAEFINRGIAHRAVYFQDPQGHGDYFTPDGKNLKKAFLRSPLEFSRITSGFSLSRFHPVLGRWRAHKGVDYAASIGTGVRATADGVVSFAGQQNGYGNLVVLQHGGKFSTAYGHLSGFGRNVRNGALVRQGDIIGYVGMTGYATGPHLHYEFRVAGIPRDPYSVDMPIAFPVAAQYRPLFARQAQQMLARLELTRNVSVASLD